MLRVNTDEIEIDLSKLRITDIKQFLLTKETLEVCDVFDRQIKYLDSRNTLDLLPISLNLSGNQLSNLPISTVIDLLYGLVSKVLQPLCDITSIKRLLEFKWLFASRIRSIIMYNNLLYEMPDLSAMKLDVVNVSRNKISSLHRLTNCDIKVLDLSFNRLSCINDINEMLKNNRISAMLDISMNSITNGTELIKRHNNSDCEVFSYNNII